MLDLNLSRNLTCLQEIDYRFQVLAPRAENTYHFAWIGRA